jgi:23S rRNA pseudouridine2605 synthase
MRLNRFLAACGVASRRKAEALIEEGRVMLNGTRVTELATFVKPGRDAVTVDGEPVALPARPTWILLHKPAGVVSTVLDPEGRPTVVALVPAEPRVFPVGRLDRDTSGALLLTNDGALTHQLLHPRYHVEKEYEVVVEGVVPNRAMGALRRGILLEGEERPTAPAVVEVLTPGPPRTRLRLVLGEGRNRQVRRMLEAVGHPVLQLQRVRIGPLTLGDLPVGGWRHLAEEEIRALRREIGRAPRSKPPPRHP